jgi:hypothetical protein
MIGGMRFGYRRGRYFLRYCVQSGFVVDTASSTVGTGTLSTSREMTAQIRPLPEVKTESKYNSTTSFIILGMELN